MEKSRIRLASIAIVASVLGIGCVYGDGSELSAEGWEQELVPTQSGTVDVDFDGSSHVSEVLVPDLICASGRIHFDGRCRKLSYFERFVTPGATLVLVEGANATGEGVAIYERPNARTHRVRRISATPAPSRRFVNRKYMADFEVIAELTQTAWLGDDGYHYTAITQEDNSSGAFRTEWWETTAEGGGSVYRWSSDLCDANGCASELSIASSGSTTDLCEARGEAHAANLGNGCRILFGSAGLGAVAGTLAGTVMVGSAGSAAPFVAAGAAIVAAGALICAGVEGSVEAESRLMCLEQAASADPAPAAIGVSVAVPSGPLATSACDEMGGVFGDDPAAQNILSVASCAEEEGTGSAAASDTSTQVVLSVDDAALEITVWGDPNECDVPDPNPIDPNTCVVILE